LFLCDKSVKLL